MVRRQVAAEIEAGIKILRAAASDLEARPIEGLSADAAEALLQFAERIRAGIVKADTLPAAQRRVYEMLRLRVKIAPDRERGVRLARWNRYSVAPEALIELRNGERPLLLERAW